MSISSIPFLLDCPPTIPLSRLPQTTNSIKTGEEEKLSTGWQQTVDSRLPGFKSLPGPVPQASNGTSLMGLS